MKLNLPLIQRRRRELGLSERALSRGMRISPTRLQPLLQGNNHEFLTLQQVNDLARALNIDTKDLLTHDRTDTSDSTDNAPPENASAATVVALLQSAGRHIPPAALAEAAELTLEELHETLSVADQHLRSIGLRIGRHTNDGSVTVTADTARLADEQVTTALRGASARLQLTAATARLVHDIITNTRTRKAVEASNDRRTALGNLINTGIVATPDTYIEPLRVSSDVAESLLLNSH